MRRIVEDAGNWRCRADLIPSGGPVRVVTDEPDPTFKPRPVGFTADIEASEIEHEEPTE